MVNVPSWVNLAGWIATFIVSLMFYRSARSRLQAMDAKLSPLGPQVEGHEKRFVTVEKALGELAPPDARPTTGHRERLPLAPADTSKPASTASAPARGAPRINVEIRRSPFPGEVYVVLAQTDGQPIVLAVDARDVDVREGTMPVNVLHVRAGLVKVELPPERPQRRVVWLAQMAVRDCTDAPMPGAPVAHFDAEGDRGGVLPGDAIPSESAEDIRARFEAEADARSQARDGQLPSVAGEDEPEDERTRVYSGRPRRPTLMGGLAGAPQAKRSTWADSKPENTLVSPGVEPPAGEEVDTPLSPEDEERLNELAAHHGLSPDEMAKRLAHTGIEREERRKDRGAPPPSPKPEGPKPPKR